MNELRFVLDFVFGLLVGAFLLRLIFQLVRADFRNPFAQAIVRVTNPIVVPLRKVLPPIGRVDTASVVAVLLAQVLRTVVDQWLGIGAIASIGALVALAVVSLLDTTLMLFLVAIFVYVLLSWVSPDPYNPMSRLLGSLVEPILGPFRRALPSLGGLDLSPIVVILIISVLRMILNNRLAPLLLSALA
jgi:YggT family protein